jgi:hypothetical protein
LGLVRSAGQICFGPLGRPLEPRFDPGAAPRPPPRARGSPLLTGNRDVSVRGWRSLLARGVGWTFLIVSGVLADWLELMQRLIRSGRSAEVIKAGAPRLSTARADLEMGGARRDPAPGLSCCDGARGHSHDRVDPTRTRHPSRERRGRRSGAGAAQSGAQDSGGDRRRRGVSGRRITTSRSCAAMRRFQHQRPHWLASAWSR